MLKNLGFNRPGIRQLAPAAATPGLDSVLASTVFHVDATISASYPGTGTTWANLVAAPADGASQQDYNFTLHGGLSFTGAANDAGAYLLTDGTGYAQLPTNTAFINDLHKTAGSDFWFMAAIYTPDDSVAADGLFGTAAETSAAAEGFRCYIAGSSQRLFIRQHDGSNFTASGSSSGTVPEDMNMILILSHSRALNQTTFWTASTTGETIAHTFNPTTEDAMLALTLMSEPGFKLPDGCKAYAFAMGNEYLDDTKAGAIFTALENAHGRTYTNN